MNLRRVRLRVALVYGLVSAVAVGALAWYAVSAGTDRLQQQAMAELQTRAGQLIAANSSNRLPTSGYDTWVVDTRTGQVYAIGRHDVEPPLGTLVDRADANQGTATDTFSVGGASFAVVAQRIFKTDYVAVVVSSLTSTQQAMARLRWRVGLAAVAVVLFTSLMAYFLSGWSLRPARRAAEQQRQFLANAAHELRTPIAVIQATASQALQRARSPEEYVLALAQVRSAAERAGSGVSDMLDLARLESGQAVPHRVPLRLDLLCEEVVSAVSANLAGGTEVGMARADPLVIEADYGLLRQAVDNLVRNAIRRAPRVGVSTYAAGRDAVVEVADDGPGFDPAFLPHAFDRFRSDPGSVEGTGLGLAIVRSIVEAHGGRAEAANRPAGGAVIRLLLPAGRPELSAGG